MAEGLRILLLGKSGQLGQALQASLAPLGEVIAIDRHHPDLCGDLSRPDAVAETVRFIRPDVIVNAAAYTAVDLAEREIEKARIVNALAPCVLATEARKLDALLLHFSTDYVFDGSGTRAWREDDATAPLNVYGRTKREGEVCIESAECRHLIFRSSWLHGGNGRNFVRSMLRLGAEREQLKVVNDQIGAPTSVRFLAEVSARAITRVGCGEMQCGIYHCASAGETSWFDYARFIFSNASQAGLELKIRNLHPVSSDEYVCAAKRPLNSRLDCGRLQSVLGSAFPDWREGVKETIQSVTMEGRA